MNLSLFLSFLLATVAITAAAPIVEEDTTDVFNATTQQLLEKRAHYGWISSFAPDDTDCKRGWAPPRPKLIGDRCIKYHPYGPNVGIHWGSWPLKHYALDIYSDDKCKDFIKTIYKAADSHPACVTYQGENWQSVRSHKESKVG